MLYLECYSGISGDMTVAALLDLGADRKKLEEGLASLHVDGYEIRIGRRVKCGLDACSFDVILEGPEDGLSHDYEEHSPADAGHEHSHEDHGHHEHGHGAHVHRNLPQIMEIIRGSRMTEGAKELAVRIFTIVAEAEAKVHGKPVDEVHFHEVGAVDSIVDICAAAICLDDLGIREAAASEIAAGSGHVRCQHGILPVPVPAVTAIAEQYGLVLRASDQKGEMVTPTGAAILAGICSRDALPASYRIVKSGMGAGKKDFPKANVLRAYLIEEAGEKPALQSGEPEKKEEKTDPGTLWTLETNIDDVTGEALGYVMDRLLKAGARDVCYIPAFMKKSRPAYLVKVICEERDREAIEDLIFCHTTTIGIRRYPIERTVLPRKMFSLETPYGTVRVKQVRRGEMVFNYPEYEDVARCADVSGRPFQETYEEVRRLARRIRV